MKFKIKNLEFVSQNKQKEGYPGDPGEALSHL